MSAQLELPVAWAEEVEREARPRLLDLFCCEGGAGEGYRLAGFDVVGVDVVPRDYHPGEFAQADAVAYMLGRIFP